MSVEELESLVSDLSADELAQFSQWFEEFMADLAAKGIDFIAPNRRGHAQTQGRQRVAVPIAGAGEIERLFARLQHFRRSLALL